MSNLWSRGRSSGGPGEFLKKSVSFCPILSRMVAGPADSTTLSMKGLVTREALLLGLFLGSFLCQVRPEMLWIALQGEQTLDSGLPTHGRNL